MRIYVESTIPSYLVARPARDLLQAARQQLTLDWWDAQRHLHELFASQIVLDEIAQGEKVLAQKRLTTLAGLPLLALIPEAASLAQIFLDSGALPRKADRDAAHISLATIHGMDILLTWNCRHIANAAIQLQLRRIVEVEGWTLPLICTPEELSDESAE